MLRVRALVSLRVWGVCMSLCEYHDYASLTIHQEPITRLITSAYPYMHARTHTHTHTRVKHTHTHTFIRMKNNPTPPICTHTHAHTLTQTRKPPDILTRHRRVCLRNLWHGSLPKHLRRRLKTFDQRAFFTEKMCVKCFVPDIATWRTAVELSPAIWYDEIFGGLIVIWLTYFLVIIVRLPTHSCTHTHTHTHTHNLSSWCPTYSEFCQSYQRPFRTVKVERLLAINSAT